MILNTTVRRLLLVAADDSVETDLFAALKMSEVVQKFAGVFELVFFPLQHEPYFLDILHLLNKVRDGFFEAVYLIPPAASWSRLRSSTTAGTASTQIAIRTLGIVVVEPATDRESTTIQWRQSRGWQLSQHDAKFVASVWYSSSRRISGATLKTGLPRRGRLVSSKTWKELVM